MPITITFSTAGNFTIEDDGTPGNATSIVRRDSDGAVLAVIPHPADSLVFSGPEPTTIKRISLSALNDFARNRAADSKAALIGPMYP